MTLNALTKSSLIAMTVLLSLGASTAMASDASNANVGSDHLGLKGYDPVSYFSGKPAPGKTEITAEHQGILYRFANDENRQKFAASPEQYAPAYGGWCATALAKDGSKVDIDPNSYKVTGGRLYLFYKGFWGSAIDDWVKDEPANIVKADKSWRTILSK